MYSQELGTASVSSLKISEKAKNLRCEITELDDEIAELQNNLKNAIKKKNKENIALWLSLH